jgi:translocation and assembly module TamB
MSIKSILGAFIFVIFAFIAASVFFVQTDSFGDLFSRVLNDLTRKSLSTKIDIKNVSLSFFPPGIEFNQVILNKKISDNEYVESEFGKLGFYFGIIEFDEKKITFGEARILDGYIKYSKPEDGEELKEIDKHVVNKIFDFPNSFYIRIDTVLVENTRLDVNEFSVELKRVKIVRNSHFFTTKLHLANLRNSKKEKFEIDEIWSEFELHKKILKIKRMKILHDVQGVLLSGEIRDYNKIKGSSAIIDGEFQFYLKKINSFLKIPENILIHGGFLKSNFKINYENYKLSGEINSKIKHLKSSFIIADELSASFQFNNSSIRLSKLDLVLRKEKLKLVQPIELLDLEKNSFLPVPVKLILSRFSLKNALRALGPEFNILKGNISGVIIFERKNNNYHFTPQDSFLIQDLKLVTGTDNDPFDLIKIKKAVLNKTKFSLIDGRFQMYSSVVLPKSKLEINGKISDDKLFFEVPESQINLEDFGNISSLDIKGFGKLALNVSGTGKETIINIKGKTKGFEILGFKLDETEKNISINLSDSTVVLHKVESQMGKTQISGNGIVNYKNRDIALGITSINAEYNDLNEILTPVLSGIDFIPEDLDFNSRVDVDIFGKYNLEDLKIKSKVKFTDFHAFGETIDNGTFDIVLIKNNLSFLQLDAQKGSGNIMGDFSYNLNEKIFKLKYDWENISFSNLNLKNKLGFNFTSFLSGNISGGGGVNDYKIVVDALSFDSKSGNYVFEDSKLNLVLYPNRIAGFLNIFGNNIKTKFDLGLVPGSYSDLTLVIKTGKIKPLLVATIGQHLEMENFTGVFDFNGTVRFKNDFSDIDLSAILSELSFVHSDFNINYISNKQQFLIEKGIIKNWNLNINNTDFTIKTSGNGSIGKDFRLDHDIKLNSKFLEIISSAITSSEGLIDIFYTINGYGKVVTSEVFSSTNDLDMNIEHFPVALNNMKYNLNYFDKKLIVKNFSTEFDKGSISVLGDIYFDNSQPDVNLKFQINKAEYPFMGKSSLNFSGDGIILGNNFPYTLSGEVLINSGQILNEINEFSSKSAAFSQVRFLPKNQESPFSKVIAINLNVKAQNPIRITNSLMDVALLGEVRLTGNPERPRAEGRITVPPNTSRIFFKNNEYLITSTDINFNSKKEITNPEFDIQALTFISSYKIYPKAYGNLERFTFDLTSEPSLPRNSILSLIAFGYTNEIQSTLYAKDQQSLTQVGVGSFVFDRFKISDILNKQFGLQVNLGTVIEQSSTDSLISGRNQSSGAGTVGRTRSATKIELKKRLDEALTLSVSSTMGGTIGQRQSMNLNYGFTKNIQVEGVYELRTNEEGQADIIYNSIGGDLKFRRTFK